MRGVPAASGSGNALVAWIFLALLVWIALQFRPSRRAVWKARFEAMQPILAYVKADAVAVWTAIAHRLQVRRARGEINRGLEDLLG